MEEKEGGSMMRYMLFAGTTYYPNGGIDDLKGLFSSKDECIICLLSDEDLEFIDWAHIYDTQEKSVIKIEISCEGDMKKIELEEA